MVLPRRVLLAPKPSVPPAVEGQPCTPSSRMGRSDGLGDSQTYPAKT